MKENSFVINEETIAVVYFQTKRDFLGFVVQKSVHVGAELRVGERNRIRVLCVVLSMFPTCSASLHVVSAVVVACD